MSRALYNENIAWQAEKHQNGGMEKKPPKNDKSSAENCAKN